jgi:hypothetical protein
MRHWLAKPHQTEPQFLAWREAYPDLVSLETVPQYVGLTAYAITVTDFSIPPEEKGQLLFSVPHAHEPAGTVACMHFIQQLLAGTTFDGEAVDLDREAILRHCVLSFIPDANPDGRSRAPVDWWDGSQYTNEEFWTFMRGRDPETGKVWKRLGRWDRREEQPETIGIVYEQLNEYEYVEPNRDFGSAYYRLARKVFDRYGSGRWCDLHQTEFERSDYNCMVILPIVHPDLPAEVRAVNEAWAAEIVRRWQAAGAHPIPESKPLSYTGEQAEYFYRAWREFIPHQPYVTTEIQNNNPRTPPAQQVELQWIAIQASVELLLKGRQLAI